jgi:hypothetical protein
MLERLSLSLEQLLELALESLEFVESAPDFFCIVIVVVLAAIAAATRAAGSIIAVVIIIVARIATMIIFIVAMPLNHAEPPVRHVRGLVLMVSLAEGVLCKVEQHFLEIRIADSRTDGLSHHRFSSLDVAECYRISTASSTGWRVSYASD